METKLNRIYGYDILINNFETFLRIFLSGEVFFRNYGTDWAKYIPQGVINELSANKVTTATTSFTDFTARISFIAKLIMRRSACCRDAFSPINAG